MQVSISERWGSVAKAKTASVDDQLTEHLNQAEDHLISAVNLFAEEPTLNRRVGYLERLVRTQETVTSLHREELVRVQISRGRRRKKR